ncbi:MAG: hypothetical protein R3321_00065 [Nitrososphaeraceae archaeon]|nr:hypothetical protein [Nitrososphaeraceae archaeon]
MQLDYGGFSKNGINQFKNGIITIVKYKDLEIGLEYEPNSIRHGHYLPCGYGHIRGIKGFDGMALDCYLHPDLLDSNIDHKPIFAITQMKRYGDEFDEYKVMLGFDDIIDAELTYKKCMPTWKFGGIREIKYEDLWAL